MHRLSWIKAALKDFRKFPDDVQLRVAEALDLVSEGAYPDSVKPLAGFEEGVFEVALAMRGNAWRCVYALKIDQDIWIIHTFQKKSTEGIKTQKRHIA